MALLFLPQRIALGNCIQGEKQNQDYVSYRHNHEVFTIISKPASFSGQTTYLPGGANPVN